MAVGKIEYKNVLDDKKLTPKKLRDLYISKLEKDPFFKFATSSEDRYTIMSPEEAAAVIAGRQTDDSTTDNSTETSIETSTEPSTDGVQTLGYQTFAPIQGGIWNPTIGTSPTFTRQSATTNIDKITFVQMMLPTYAKVLQERGLDVKFAPYLVAQDALETGWGKHLAGKNNFGGIKVDSGVKGTFNNTKEWNGSRMVPTTSEFRNFANLEDYVNFKIDFVGRSRYNVFSYSPDEYIDRVAAGGYATDPNYVGKVKNILSEINSMI